MKRKPRVDIRWTHSLAYVIGVLATDGNLSPDGRHINLTSKDKETVDTTKRLLGIENKIGKKSRTNSGDKKYYVLQFGDTTFYEFLNSIGLYKAKSKTLSRIQIPNQYFADFLRGCVDGDGNITSFRHPESKILQFRIRLASASPTFLRWILKMSKELLGITGGYIYAQKEKGVFMLNFAKQDSRKIIEAMYHDLNAPALTRKKLAALLLVATK